MEIDHLNWLIAQLRGNHISPWHQETYVSLEEGLSDSEIADIENKYGFRFPPDYGDLLQLALPVSELFTDWRRGPESQIRHMLDWPLEGMKFDIEYNSFWMKEWGPKPVELIDAFRIAEIEVGKAPFLIPIYSHRYIPAEPNLPGNPVFSVYQTDIIYCGYDLASYFAREFFFELPDWAAKEPRAIRFWDRVVEMDNE